MNCKHTNANDSTLVLDLKPASPEMPHKTWVCTCSVCGKTTEACLTDREAQLRGMRGMWEEVVTCISCKFSHIETHKGESELVCWVDPCKGGKVRESGYTCPKAVRRDV